MAGTLRRGLRWLAIAVGGLLMVLVLAWSVSRLWPMPPDQMRALALMHEGAPAEGRNGYALLWTLDRDGMDGAARAQALALDAEQWRLRAKLEDGTAALRGRVHLDPQGRCPGRGRGCLAAVRADPERFARAHAGHDRLHERVAALGGFDHFTGPWVHDVAALMPPFPVYTSMVDPAAGHALAYVQGDIDGGLHGLCSGMVAGRKLLGGSDSLLGSMVGASLIEINGNVLGDVLAELRAEVVLPAACEDALKPMQASEMSLCRPLQGELALSAMAQQASLREARWTGLLFDTRRSLSRIASQQSWACDPALQDLLAEDHPIPAPPRLERGVDCFANAIGCILADIAGPGYLPYGGRSQDAAAMVRLLGAQRWLRFQSQAPAMALRELPAMLRSATRTPSVSEDGRWLQLPRHGGDPHDPQQSLLRVPLFPAAVGVAQPGSD